MTTRGRRPSCSIAARAWLKYASVYQPARIFSTGRSKTSGSSLGRCGGGIFELQARTQRGVRDLELPLVRLSGGEPMLQLVPWPGESAGEPVARVARHPAEQLRRDGDGAECARRARSLEAALRDVPGSD